MKTADRTRLTPTSYTLLGLLARRPWSAYELNKYMQLSALRRIWPRAESRIYEEPKKLAALGLASLAEEYQGARKRSVYRITAAGRRALAAWFAEPGAELVYEYETLVKLLNGDHCDDATLLALIEEVRRQAREEARQVMAACEQILEEGWRIPETAEHNGLVIGFIRENIEARLRWADAAEKRLGERRRSRAETAEARARRWYRDEIERLQALA
ncbi:hypothetical protein B9N43_11775 [Denitratisoma sp. DHT3]|uniref:helix-turn-helix transcriptional regulator n=1 Tax=Denitratisoma sp. DHT3 TaxID=1981880 RepID=UPI00119840EF|nr:helix-turn-helix transcriptional regulator [Denitratisoma sp. DHT3]QDX81870.1 hypothetical protein B9N43_11775 [Denitratisoma sp. DHT3]